MQVINVFRAPGAYSRGPICNNDLLGGGIFKGGGVIEEVPYITKIHNY